MLCLHRYARLLTDWEKGFYASLIGLWNVSPKQRRCMNRILGKVPLVALGEEGGDDEF